ncbi:hypothetical protein [Domibacillus tundrae]|uniref:hypothetical protein n=1 Tax=Domibacillus tundrae TaxID=1587527 RepID=UPI000617D9DB|nr:hypothetical protein [Domibacillus tundrae]
MLKVIVSENEKSKSKLLVDGVTITGDVGHFSSNGTENEWARIKDYNLSKKITEATFKEIPKEISSIYLYYPLDFTEYIKEIQLWRDLNETEFTELKFEFSWDFEKWKKPFSIEEFAGAIKEILLDYKGEAVEWMEDSEFLSNGCDLTFHDFDRNEKIKVELEKKIIIVKEILEKVDRLLITDSRKGSVVNFFDFPEHVRVPCEQYLVYFSEFLKNIGIDVTTDISHQAGRVLFSVTPVSKRTALQQIREALNVYLQLPNNFVSSDLINVHMKPEEQQLAANIQHLQGQLMLANAIMQTQNETMQNQRVMIEQQRQIIDATILQQSLLKDSTNNDSPDKEEILGGTISLTNLDVKGFQVNIPNIYRWLREKVRKE